MPLPSLEQRIARYRELSGDTLRAIAKDPLTPEEDRDAIQAEFERRRHERTARTGRSTPSAKEMTSPSASMTSRHRRAATEGPREGRASVQEVTVRDLDMPFASMVVFMVKWALASIPAFIILFAIFFVFFLLLRGFIGR